jgi:hypothetical protein
LLAEVELVLHNIITVAVVVVALYIIQRFQLHQAVQLH